MYSLASKCRFPLLVPCPRPVSLHVLSRRFIYNTHPTGKRHSKIFKLWCWIYSNHVYDIFPIEMSSMRTVSILKKALKDEKPTDLGHVDTKDSFLYKSSIASDEGIKRTLRRLTFDRNEALNSQQALSQVFSDSDPPLKDHLHIVIEAPLPRGKYTGEAVDDVVELVNRTKIANESPSSLAKPQSFRLWHSDPTQCFLDHRRVYHAGNNEPSGNDVIRDVNDFPPISHQYGGFGLFLDIFRGRKDVPGMENVLSSKLQLAVDDFAEKMSLIYHHENVRRKIGIAALNDIFSARTDSLSFQLTAATMGSKGSTDGHMLGPDHGSYCIVEFKNEAANISSIPYVEMMGYFAHSVRLAMGYSASITRDRNIPCLGLTIIGRYVTFYAMLRVYSGQWRVVSLTPGLSCIRASGDGDDRIALYKAFTAATILLARIRQEATELIHSRSKGA